MSKFNFPQNIAADTKAIPTTVASKNADVTPVAKKEDSTFSSSEQIKLIIFGVITITIIVASTFLLTRYSYTSDLQKYKQVSDAKLIELKNKLDILTNNSVKQIDDYENIIRGKLTNYNKEKSDLETNSVFVEINKKTKELDKQIIICNVHLNNIKIVKENNYKDSELLLEKLNKDNIK